MPNPSSYTAHATRLHNSASAAWPRTCSSCLSCSPTLRCAKHADVTRGRTASRAASSSSRGAPGNGAAVAGPSLAPPSRLTAPASSMLSWPPAAPSPPPWEAAAAGRALLGRRALALLRVRSAWRQHSGNQPSTQLPTFDNKQQPPCPPRHAPYVAKYPAQGIALPCRNTTWPPRLTHLARWAPPGPPPVPPSWPAAAAAAPGPSQSMRRLVPNMTAAVVRGSSRRYPGDRSRGAPGSGTMGLGDESSGASPCPADFGRPGPGLLLRRAAAPASAKRRLRPKTAEGAERSGSAARSGSGA